MKRKLKRIFTITLAVVMIALAMPTASFAYEDEADPYDYLFSYINILGDRREQGYIEVYHYLDWDDNVSFLYYPDYDYISLVNYGSRSYALWGDTYMDIEYQVDFVIDRNCDTYAVIVQFGNDYNYAMGYDMDFNPSDYVYGGLSSDFILDEEDLCLSDLDEDEAFDLFAELVAEAFDDIDDCLLDYSSIELGNFGFKCYDKWVLEDADINGLYKSNSGWKYYTDNSIDYDYDGVALNAFGCWKICNGTIDFRANGFVYSEFDDAYYYTEGGKVKVEITGLVKDPEDGLWKYVERGEANFDYEGMAKNEWGWWYVNDGTINFNYTGMAKNEWGWWYIKNGKLDTTYTGMAKNAWGWWYMKNGKFDRSYTGLAKNAWGWWYMNKGTIDYDFEGLVKNQYGWWYVENGTINFKYNGYAYNQYGYWKVVNGKVVS